MQKTDAYPPLGWEYDDTSRPMLSHRVVYGILGAAALVLLLVGAATIDAGYHGYEMVRSFL